MLFAVGFLIVIAIVIGGYIGAGGHLMVLFQPFEFVIIFGGAIGAFIISNPLPVVIGTLKSLGALLKGSKLSKASYIELLSLGQIDLAAPVVLRRVQVAILVF